MNIFNETHLDYLSKLLENKVDFLLVGGYAVNYYGYNRTTGDMDLWLNPNDDNKERFIQFLESESFSSGSINQIKGLNFKDHHAFHIGDFPFRIDFLTAINGVDFKEADAQKLIYDNEGLSIPVIHINHLIRSKMTTDRLRDKADVEELQKIQRLKNK